MEVVACNIGAKKEIVWRGKKVFTGIYKESVDQPIFLDSCDVENDEVIDRKYHGGKDKACYFFGANHYDYYKLQYSELDLKPGFFGENITLNHLDERNIYPGDEFQLGQAHIKITDPREPCFKLGIRFGDQKILKKFRDYGFSGFYVSIIRPGKVQVGDSLQLIHRHREDFSIYRLFHLRHHPPATQSEMRKMIEEHKIPEFAYKKWPIKISK